VRRLFDWARENKADFISRRIELKDPTEVKLNIGRQRPFIFGRIGPNAPQQREFENNSPHGLMIF
jgi:hypothetical protein